MGTRDHGNRDRDQGPELQPYSSSSQNLGFSRTQTPSSSSKKHKVFSTTEHTLLKLVRLLGGEETLTEPKPRVRVPKNYSSQNCNPIVLVPKTNSFLELKLIVLVKQNKRKLKRDGKCNWARGFKPPCVYTYAKREGKFNWAWGLKPPCPHTYARRESLTGHGDLSPHARIPMQKGREN